MGIISRLISKKTTAKREAEAGYAFQEPAPADAVRTIDIEGMTDDKVRQTLAFIEPFFEDGMPEYTLQRNGDVVRITLPAAIGFYDYCTWVNNFIFADSGGHFYQVRGRYPVTAVSWGGIQVGAGSLDLFTPGSLTGDDADCVFFQTPAGARYRFSLSRDAVSAF